MLTTSLLPMSIPYLESDDINWAMFLMRFREVMLATRRWGYIDGTKLCPVSKKADAPRHRKRGERELET